MAPIQLRNKPINYELIFIVLYLYCWEFADLSSSDIIRGFFTSEDQRSKSNRSLCETVPIFISMEAKSLCEFIYHLVNGFFR